MLKVFEAFAGIGTQRMALRNLKIDHEVVAIAEIDKFAIKSYEAIHGKTHNVGDISKLAAEDIPEHDLFTYSFPCTNLSVAGKQAGFEKGSGTASSLLWECQRVIDNKKPKYLLMENVKNLIGKKFMPGFQEWVNYLESLGYSNYYEVLNAKDFGIPQNRERVFMVSILGEHDPYVFPEKFELTSRLKDVLEDKVDEKFYLSQKIQDRLTLNINMINEIKTIGSTKGKDNTRQGQRDVVYSDEGIMGALNATDYKQPRQIAEPKIIDDQGRTKKKLKLKDYAPTLRAQSHGNEPKVVETTVSYNRKDGVGKEIDVAHTLNSSDYRGLNRNQTQNAVVEPKIAASRGRENGQQFEYNKQGTSNALTTVQKDNYVVEGISDKFSFVKKRSTEMIDKYGELPEMYNPYNKSKITDISPTITTSSDRASNSGQVLLNNNSRIRKLTPKECWRLMGCSDEDFHKAEEVNSNTQLYKQAGNAIVVSVLEAIFRNVFLDVPDEDLIGEHIPLF